jgi:hypothetical protein
MRRSSLYAMGMGIGYRYRCISCTTTPTLTSTRRLSARCFRSYNQVGNPIRVHPLTASTLPFHQYYTIHTLLYPVHTSHTGTLTIFNPLVSSRINNQKHSKNGFSYSQRKLEHRITRAALQNPRDGLESDGMHRYMRIV